jgi:hypothetical protein
VNEDFPSRHSAVTENRPVRCDSRRTQACAQVVVDAVGQRNNIDVRNAGSLCSGAERPIRLRAVHPGTMADAAGIDAGADRVDHTCAVTVKNHPRKRH